MMDGDGRTIEMRRINIEADNAARSTKFDYAPGGFFSYQPECVSRKR